MPFIQTRKYPVSLYYRLELKSTCKRYTRCSVPLACTGVCVHAPDDPERREREILQQLSRDDQGLVLSHMALLGKEVEPNMVGAISGLFRAPVQDLCDGDIRIGFFVGDMPQWDVSLAHLALLRSVEFPPLAIPPRQYFYLMANCGEDRLWDDSVLWVVLSGYKQHQAAIEDELYGNWKSDLPPPPFNAVGVLIDAVDHLLNDHSHGGYYEEVVWARDEVKKWLKEKEKETP